MRSRSMQACGNESWYNREDAIPETLVVLGNAGDPADARVALAIEAALTDDQAVVRSHAVWAARRLGLDPLLAPVVDDPDPAVQRELDAAMS